MNNDLVKGKSNIKYLIEIDTIFTHQLMFQQDMLHLKEVCIVLVLSYR
jgi:hypothetical protein